MIREINARRKTWLSPTVDVLFIKYIFSLTAISMLIFVTTYVQCTYSVR
jgi:hypothetical protein